MADAVVTLRLRPAEFKLIQTALEIARQESQTTADNADDVRQKSQSRSEQAQFADLLGKLT